MKTMTVFEAKNHFSRALQIAAEDVVVVTRHGKPVAAIQSITERDLGDLLLERSETFWKMIERARKGKSISIDEVRKKLRLSPAMKARRK
ncbi:MAG: type II toxin-antitoxin system prevent-host-death family antitoxin [Planctomycetes bacterium]|nr:type II toxin-antitoxin system prevent-host-death family antitoxin [Planctomycetota bacterium]